VTPAPTAHRTGFELLADSRDSQNACVPEFKRVPYGAEELCSRQNPEPREKDPTQRHGDYGVFCAHPYFLLIRARHVAVVNSRRGSAYQLCIEAMGDQEQSAQVDSIAFDG
jgi:hypothetical protein